MKYIKRERGRGKEKERKREREKERKREREKERKREREKVVIFKCLDRVSITYLVFMVTDYRKKMCWPKTDG